MLTLTIAINITFMTVTLFSHQKVNVNNIAIQALRGCTHGTDKTQ
ncbi:hypothetical protein HMPREF0201_03409 [Cedecea davisae DSM 4568]|uniref:Uncharacterized protein n=1 Tax=Cedecea davisae DSM 4568 TaxID=566551 RepID=S3INR8_9ENTR|nr:hypothetical protein HMPREF0201_03409 [Cedecea davisae DSM 4568]